MTPHASRKPGGSSYPDFNAAAACSRARGLSLDPEHGPAHYNLAVAALESGDKQLARKHAAAAMKYGYELPPGFLEACGVIGTPAP